MSQPGISHTAMLDQLPTPVIAVDLELRITYVNEAACGIAGAPSDALRGKLFTDVLYSGHRVPEDSGIARAIASGRTVTEESRMETPAGLIPAEFSASPLRDETGEIVGGIEYVVDISERVAQQELAEALHESIVELSTPVLRVMDGVLAVPLIGVLDSRRTNDVMEKVLVRMRQERARVIIVDITGVPVVDTMVANHLIRQAQAIRLMGGHSILTGISPAIAKTIAHLGIDLSTIRTRGSLAQGLVHAKELIAGET